MVTLSKQRKFTFNSLLEDIRGCKCCVIKVRQYILMSSGPLHKSYNCILSQCMGFPTMWYVRPAKPQISLHIRAV